MEWFIGAGIAYYIYKALTKPQPPPPSNKNEEIILPPKKHITLIGATDSGKSSTGNALLNTQNHFAVGSEHDTTKSVKSGEYINGYMVLDTPGLLGDINFSETIFETAKKSKILVYVTKGQLYRQELDFIEIIGNYQSNWNRKSISTSNKRFFIVYINMLDVKENSMTKSEIQKERLLVKEQVKRWVKDEHFVFGSSSPLKNGRRVKPNIESLENLIASIISIQ